MITFTILFSEGPAVEYTPATMNLDAGYRDALSYAERIANGLEIVMVY